MGSEHPPVRRDGSFSSVRASSPPALPVRQRRPRLAAFAYEGHFAYHVTMTTFHHGGIYNNFEYGRRDTSLLLKAAEASGFSILIYCFMPDHVHLLVEGTSESANLKVFIQRFKQLSSYAHKKTTGEPHLWQQSYFDHVIRGENDLQSVADYILTNPINEGLVEDAWAYSLLGGRYYEETVADGAEAAVPPSYLVSQAEAALPKIESASLNPIPGAQ